MALNRMKEELSRLERLVDGWIEGGEIPRIERDMALEELRHIYDAILDYKPAEVEHNPEELVAKSMQVPVEKVAMEVPPVVATVDVEEHDEVGDAFDDALDIDALLGLTGDDPIAEEPEVVVEAEPVVEDVAETVVEDVAETIEEEPTEEQPVQEEENAEQERPVGGGLFDIEDIPVRKTTGRRMISLYNEPVTQVTTTEPIETPKPEPKPEPKSEPKPMPVEESQPQRLGDVIAKDVTVLGDKMAVEEQPTPFNRITEIRKAIGLNDKFLLIRDLFDGDAVLYDQTITRLDEFDDLDDCMIYIVENFRWNPDSAGAKLLVSLIERKLA